jgi:hypothetical protein
VSGWIERLKHPLKPKANGLLSGLAANKPIVQIGLNGILEPTSRVHLAAPSP